jgi:CxxC-x17-CxxC domain-containing protein
MATAGSNKIVTSLFLLRRGFVTVKTAPCIHTIARREKKSFAVPQILIHSQRGRCGLFLYTQKLHTEERRGKGNVTIIVDDAGSGDLLFGIVIGAFRQETAEFKYGVIDVKFFQPDQYCGKSYLTEAARITTALLEGLKAKPDEEVHLCQGYIFDEAAKGLKERLGEELGEKLIQRVRVIGEAQRLTEIAYLDEIRNLGYEPLAEREEKRAKSFFHMMRWLKNNPEMLRYAKTGWPRLKRYRLFKLAQDGEDGEVKAFHEARCSECGEECEVPFKPDPHRPVYCKACWGKRRREQLAKRGGRQRRQQSPSEKHLG